MLFNQVKSLVLRIVKSTPSLPHISSQNLDIFCTDIALVALGFRTAYLLDLFHLSETIAHQFISVLREEDTVVRNVSIVFHTELEQAFFVNASLLHDIYTEAQGGSPWTSFISLTPDPQDVPVYFSDIHTISTTILNSWTNHSNCDTCISSLPSSQMIALAGYLLEYPVSYYPVASIQDSFLCDIPLDVYECTLIPSRPDLPRHTFMKFSRPAGLGSPPTALADRICRRFEQRLGQLHPAWNAIDVTCETKTMDRVAL